MDLYSLNLKDRLSCLNSRAKLSIPCDTTQCHKGLSVTEDEPVSYQTYPKTRLLDTCLQLSGTDGCIEFTKRHSTVDSTLTIPADMRR